MEGRVALVSFVVVSLVSGFAAASRSGFGGAPRNDRDLEAADPIRPLPAPPLGINRLDDLPTHLRRRESISGAGSSMTRGFRQMAQSPAPHATYPNGVFQRHTLRDGCRRTCRYSQDPVVHQRRAHVHAEPVWLGRPRCVVGGAFPLPVVDPIEMGSTPSRMVNTLSRITGYAPYFERAFGDRMITPQRVASALADYQRTRLSGNSAWDWWENGDARAFHRPRGADVPCSAATPSAAVATFGPNFTTVRSTISELAGKRHRSGTRMRAGGLLPVDQPTGAPSRRRRCATSPATHRICTTGRCPPCGTSSSSTSAVAFRIPTSTRRFARFTSPAPTPTRSLISSRR